VEQFHLEAVTKIDLENEAEPGEKEPDYVGCS
jgi:hypothetical protein